MNLKKKMGSSYSLLTEDELNTLYYQNQGMLTKSQVRTIAEEFLDEVGDAFYSYSHIESVVRKMGFPSNLFAHIFMRIFDINPPNVRGQAHSGEITLEKWVHAVALITYNHPITRATITFEIFNVQGRVDDDIRRSDDMLTFEKYKTIPDDKIDDHGRAYIELADVGRVLREILHVVRASDQFRDTEYHQLREAYAKKYNIVDEKEKQKISDDCLMTMLAERLWLAAGAHPDQHLYFRHFLVLYSGPAPKVPSVLDFFRDSLLEVFHQSV